MSADAAIEALKQILLFLGGGAIVVFAFSSWLGKVWAERLMNKERARHEKELRRIEGEVQKQINEHQVSLMRMDKRVSDFVEKFYNAALHWRSELDRAAEPSNPVREDWDVFQERKGQAQSLKQVCDRLLPIVVQSELFITDKAAKTYRTYIGAASQVSARFAAVVGPLVMDVNKGDEYRKECRLAVDGAAATLQKEARAGVEPLWPALLAESRSLVAAGWKPIGGVIDPEG